MNIREKETRTFLDEQGYFSMHNGWPDFLVYDESRAFTFCIEVKSDEYGLQENQATVHKILKKAGVPVLVVYPDETSPQELKDLIDKIYELNN